MAILDLITPVASKQPHYKTTYIIIPYSNVTDEMVKQACETSRDTIRHTVEGVDKVILKWKKADWYYKSLTPTVLRPETSKFQQFTYQQILEELKKQEWTPKEDETMSSSSSEGIVVKTTTKTTTDSVITP